MILPEANYEDKDEAQVGLGVGFQEALLEEWGREAEMGRQSAQGMVSA